PIDAAAVRQLTATPIGEVPDRSRHAQCRDVIAGRLHLLFDSVAAVLPYGPARAARGSALRAIHRYGKMRHLATMAEAGLLGLSVESWIGLFAPAGTPPEILGRLRQETRIAAAELKEQFEKSGGPLMQLPIAETNKFIKSEFELW